MRFDLLNRLILDNPILVKHLRSRLRRSSLVPGMLIVGTLCLLIVWFGTMVIGFANGAVFGLAVALQGIILVIIGASLVATAIVKVRESNILDFHRISPLPPFEITLGFFLGAPVLEYILWAIPIPLALYASLQGAPGFANFLKVEVAQIFLAWGFHGLALMMSLMAKKPKANIGGMIALMFVVFGQLGGFLFQGASQLVANPNLMFFGVGIPWLLFLVIYASAALVFELIVATRKMRSERMHALSKPQAAAFLLTASTLLIGAFWGVRRMEPLPVVVLYVLVGLGMLTTFTITPDANEYAKGLRRAERAGRRRLPFWDDLALNRVGVMFLSLIVLVGATTAWNVIESAPVVFVGSRTQGSFSLAIAIGVLVVAYSGLAFQFFALVAPKRPGSMMVLFVFLAWLAPLLAGAVVGASGASEPLWVILVSISPILGLAMSAGGTVPESLLQMAQISALLPAVIFFFLFNNLVSVYRRRVERSVEAGPAKVKAPTTELEAEPIPVL